MLPVGRKIKMEIPVQTSRWHQMARAIALVMGEKTLVEGGGE